MPCTPLTPLQVVVAPDLSATFVPPVPNLLAPLSETEPALRAVLRDLVALYPADASGAGATCPLTAVMAAAKLMAGNGGHVHAVVGSRQSQASRDGSDGLGNSHHLPAHVQPMT